MNENSACPRPLLKTLVACTMVASFAMSESSGAADAENSRDAFIREIVVTLLETRASHVGTVQHVEEACAAWERYQELMSTEPLPKISSPSGPSE